MKNKIAQMYPSAVEDCDSLNARAFKHFQGGHGGWYQPALPYEEESMWEVAVRNGGSVFFPGSREEYVRRNTSHVVNPYVNNS